MTRRERAQIAKACDLLMADDCQMAEAMAILGPMCGRNYAMTLILDADIKTVSVAEAAARPNTTFQVDAAKREAPDAGKGER